MQPDSSIHWSAYPALLFAGAFAVGIVVDGLVGPGGVMYWSGGVVLGAALYGAALWWSRRQLVTLGTLGWTIGVGLMVLCAGGARHAVFETPSPRALEPVATSTGDEPLALIGTTDEPPERSDDATRFTMAVDTVVGARDTIAVQGHVRVTLRPSPWEDTHAAFPQVYQGDRITLRGTLRPAPGQRNPGGFDYAAYLARRGTCCTMYVNDPSAVRILGRAKGVVAAVAAGRAHVRTQIRRYVASEGGQAVLQALLLGDRGQITDAQREDFARTGLMHLLAVSGLHVFLVGMMLYMLLRPLLMRFRLPWRVVEVGRAGLTVLVLGFYMMLTGARPSVVRAVVMSSLLIGGIVFQRSTHPLNALGVAALVLLMVRPTALYDVGFQLSMAAVAGIVTLQPRLSAPIPDAWRSSAATDWVVSMVVVSAAAVLGTAPVLLLHFGWVSVAGLLLNVPGIPCTGVALSAAIVMTLVGGASTMAGAAFGSAADLFVQGLLVISRLGATWLSWAGLRVPEPSVAVLGALVFGLVAVAQWPRPRLRWRCVVGTLLLATMSVWGDVIEEGPSLDLIFFDVGHGDAVLISTPTDRHMLVDTGPRSPTGSAANYSVLPFLEKRGIQHLDAVVVTHPDGDHLGGLPAVLRGVSVGQVVHSGQASDTDLYREVQRLLDAYEVSDRQMSRGDVLSFDSSVRVQVLGPPSPNAYESENDASIVLHVTYGRTSILLPGDVERQAEHDLVRTYGSQLRSQIVNVPHHGSKTSSTPGFVEAAANTAGTHAVVSAGQQNRYGMPHEAPMSEWRAHADQVHLTSKQGAVWMRSNGEEVWRVRWK